MNTYLHYLLRKHTIEGILHGNRTPRITYLPNSHHESTLIIQLALYVYKHNVEGTSGDARSWKFRGNMVIAVHRRVDNFHLIRLSITKRTRLETEKPYPIVVCYYRNWRKMFHRGEREKRL